MFSDPTFLDERVNCPDDNGHIQATGFDLNNRKQYRYHKKWNMMRSETKFHRFYEFEKSLPLLRSKIKRDMNGEGLTKSKVLPPLST